MNLVNEEIEGRFGEVCLFCLGKLTIVSVFFAAIATPFAFATSIPIGGIVHVTEKMDLPVIRGALAPGSFYRVIGAELLEDDSVAIRLALLLTKDDQEDASKLLLRPGGAVVKLAKDQVFPRTFGDSSVFAKTEIFPPKTHRPGESCPWWP